MELWKTLHRTTLLTHDKYLTVENHTIELPGGQVLDNWAWLTTPDYINVVAVTTDGEFICFRQTKYAVEGVSLAPVGGYIEPGEDPLAAAQRELLEETGYRAERWHALGQYVVDGNRGAGIAHLFLAEEAQPVAARNADDLEEQELLLLSRAEIEQALAGGQFKVLPWTTVVALSPLKLGQ
jgi:ADP-ribose pyrophosphatase